MTGVELHPLPPNDPVQQTTVHNEDPSRERVQTCWEMTKRLCSFVCNPPPFPPLTRREAINNYLLAGTFLFIGFGIGGIVTSLLVVKGVNPPDNRDVVFPTIMVGFAELVCVGSSIYGIHLLKRTCTAPRVGEQQRLLPARPPSNA